MRWFPFEQREFEGFEDEPPMRCFLGKVFFFCARRNAWIYWSSIYPGDDAFLPDLAECKRRIEERRVQGTHWTIEEIPVLVFAGKVNSLVIGEIESTDPLSDFPAPTKTPISLEALGYRFASLKPNSVFRFLCESRLMAPAQLPFYEHDSVSPGGKVALRWSTSVLDIEIVSIPFWIYRVCALLGVETISNVAPRRVHRKRRRR